METLSVIEVGSRIKDTVGIVYQGIQEYRFDQFSKACQAAINEKREKDVSLRDCQKWFENDFAQKRIYDYLKRAIDNTSTYARYALGRIYIEYASGVSTYVPYEESILLRAFDSLDDYEVELFLLVFDHCVQNNIGFQENFILLKDGEREELTFYLPLTEFQNLKDSYGRTGRELFRPALGTYDDFISRRVLGSRGSAAFGVGINCKFNQTSLKAIEYLRWGRKVAET